MFPNCKVWTEAPDHSLIRFARQCKLAPSPIGKAAGICPRRGTD